MGNFSSFDTFHKLLLILLFIVYNDKNILNETTFFNYLYECLELYQQQKLKELDNKLNDLILTSFNIDKIKSIDIDSNSSVNNRFLYKIIVDEFDRLNEIEKRLKTTDEWYEGGRKPIIKKVVRKY